MPNITEVANQILSKDVPVLFVDTCILLDVIRSIKRKNPKCALHAMGLHKAATVEPRQCLIVISKVVELEWTVHEQELLDEANRNLIDLEEHSQHFHDACDVFGITPGFSRSNYSSHNIGAKLRDLSQQLLKCGIVIEQDNECSFRAVHRVIHNIPPSKKGGEAKDCTILEEYLAVARRLNDVGFQKRLVFCTSNTNDYCEPGGLLHAVLATEFASIKFRFTTNLGWGFHDVTH